MKLYKLIILFIFLCISLQAQTVSVSGKVTSNRFPVAEVLVTFIDNSDTSLQYSATTDNRGEYQIGLVTSVKGTDNNIPTAFKLGQNYPNPFANSTSIPYNVEKESDIHVTIYDILGRSVRKFDVGNRSIGIHNLLWDGRNSIGNKVANGIYFYSFTVNGHAHVKKMVFNSNGLNSLSYSGSSASLKKEGFSKSSKTEVLGINFTILVQNTENTLPLIVEEEYGSVAIVNDTTINFSVSSLTTALVDFDSTHQIIRGYGAATPWYRPVATESEIQSAFGTGEGEIGLNILRLTLDPNTSNWSKWIPSAKKAYEMGAKIIAAPWYAPSNMIERVGNRNKIKQDMYDDYADHLNSYIKYMSDNGVPIYGVSIQNEPDISEDWTWWDPEDMLRFMRDFAHVIEGALVMSPESFQFRKNMSDPILNDSVATENTDVIIGHIYGGGLAKYPLAEEKGKEVWMTEYLMGENNSGNNLGWAIEFAQNITDVMQADMNAYVWWTMIRYYGPIGDGETATDPEDPRERYPDKGEVTKKGFVLSQFSKFIHPGYYRVESKITPINASADVTAYKDPITSKVVIVAVNNGTDPVDLAFRLDNGSSSSIFTPYTTSEIKNCEKGEDFSITGGNFTITLEPMSISTFVENE